MQPHDVYFHEVQRANSLRVWIAGQKRIETDKIRHVEVVSYYPHIDGGWGTRKGRGVRIVFDDGDEFRVGTRKPAELLAALDAARQPASVASA